jgi:signal transduction histidine kinase
MTSLDRELFQPTESWGRVVLWYVVAVAAVAATWGLRILFEPIIGSQAPFITFAFSVVLASVVGGFGPGLLAVILSTALIDYSFLQPLGSLLVDNPSEMMALTLYLLQGVAISLLGGSRRTTLVRLENERAELASRVRERTRELSIANEQLTRSNRELESFASVASHDLQEPLRKILAFGDRLRMQTGGSLDPAAADSLTRMLNAATRMQTLINDLLAFARVGSRAQDFVRVNLDAILTDVLVDLESRISDAGGTVHFEPMPEIEADPLQMRQLFQNLLSNALKFRRPGVPPVVRIRSHADDGRAIIEIEDNGIGFEAQYAERIFGIFQRLHGRGAYEGTGIGLAICRRIVERHHGSISASGRLGEGAMFRVTLPMEQPA